MKEFTLRFDETCKYCMVAFKYMNGAMVEEPRENMYGSRDMRTGEHIKGVLIRPDYNASGYVTHYHLNIEGNVR